MEFLKQYLKDHKKLLAAVLVSTAVAAFIFYLYDLPLGAVLYTVGILTIVLLVFFILPDFLSYVRRVKTLRELQSSILGLLEFPALSGTLPEQELMKLSASLCEKIQELETLSAGKQKEMLDYYTLWVHQVKTPLSAMRLILRSPDWEASPREAADALLQELFKVERYVEMVLGYLRLDSISSDLQLERCSLHDIVTRSVKKFAPQFIYQKLSLDLQSFDNQVLTDRKWLEFVIEQLLSNALKYTREGGVSIFADKDDVLVIRDTGVGISLEDLPRIFERGFTGCNGRIAAESHSTGLGLYLVKQVLDRLQNRIEIISQPGQGAEVRLYLHRGRWEAF